MKIINQGQDYFVTKRIESLVKRVMYVSNIVLKGRDCHIILNTRMHKLGREVMAQRTVSMQN